MIFCRKSFSKCPPACRKIVENLLFESPLLKAFGEPAFGELSTKVNLFSESQLTFLEYSMKVTLGHVD